MNEAQLQEATNRSAHRPIETENDMSTVPLTFLACLNVWGAVFSCEQQLFMVFSSHDLGF